MQLSRFERLAPWLLWLLGLGIAFYPALLAGFAKVQVGEGDPRLVNYTLEHSYRWVAGEPINASFWSPPIFHPEEGVGGYVDTMVGSAPLYWIPRATGASPGLALQLWMMASLSLAFLVVYWLLARSLFLQPACAALGAFLFAFGAPRVANLGSPQLLAFFFGALALAALFPLFREREPVPGRLAGPVPWVFVFFGALALQCWSAFYPSFFLAFALAIAFCVGLVLRESRRRILALVRAHPVAIASAALLSAAAIWPMVQAHLAASEALGYRDYAEVREGVAEWYSWVFPGRQSLIYRKLFTPELFRFDSAASQHTSGLGLVVLGLSACGFYLRRDRVSTRLLVVTAVVMIALSTRIPGTDGVSAWKGVFELVPGGKAIRYPARIGLMMPFLYALGAAFACAEIRKRGRIGLALFLGAICVAEQLQVLYATDDARYRRAIERIAAEVDPACESFFLIVDFDAETVERVVKAPSPRTSQIAAMFVGLEAGVRTLNGSYGNHPPKWAMFSIDVADDEKNRQVLRALDRWKKRKGLSDEQVCAVRIPGSWLPWLFAAPD